MKRLLCSLLACAVCATVTASFAGCGCSNNSNQEPGYVVEATEPDLKNDNFGFFIIDNDELMITEYIGDSKDVVIPESYNNYKVTVVGKSVFNGSDIQSVTFPDSIREIKDFAFSSCQNLKSVKLPKNLKILGASVFFNCSELSEVEIPASLEDMGLRTFSAAGLKSVTIPESTTLKKIGEFVFYQCQELKQVNIPDTIISIKESSFSDCPNKITITAPKGSYAQNYAKKYNFDFVAAD